jgi:osmotically-inducible protein OsmY
MKTDAQLQQDVIAELRWEPSVQAEQVGVEVKDGVVTLAGEVSSFAEKWAAESAALRVAGVKALAIELDVKLSALGQRNDVDIARSAQNVLEWTTCLPTDGVKLMVEAGWITLSGEVVWQYQKQVAADALRHLVGVTGVSNQIAIKPKGPTSAVKSDIEAALKRRARLDARQITVGVSGAEVTLSGSVRNWAERDLATHSAWCAPDVRNVVDHMTLLH